MTAQLHVVGDLPARREDPRQTVVSGPVIPLLEAIKEYTGCSHQEAVRRTAHYVERMWDAGIILMPAAQHLAGRFRIPTAVAFLVFLIGWVIGKLELVSLAAASLAG